MKTPGTIEVSEADYRRQRKAYEAMLAALIATEKHIDDDMNNRPIVLWKLRDTVLAALKLAEGD